MPFLSVQFYIYHFTLFVFHLSYGLCMLCLEVAYQVYMAVVENMIVPAACALWTTELQLVRIACRMLLALPSLFLRSVLTSRNEEKRMVVTRHNDAVNVAFIATKTLPRCEGYCVSELWDFIKAHIIVVWSGIKLKMTDGKRMQEQSLLAKIQAMYSDLS